MVSFVDGGRNRELVWLGVGHLSGARMVFVSKY